MEGSCQMSRYTLGEYCKDRGKLALWPLLLSASSFPSGLVLGPIPSRAPNGLSLETHTTWWNNFFCVPPRWTGGMADVSEALDPPNQHSEKHVWGTGELQTRTKYLFCCFCSSQHQGTVVLLFFHCLFWHTVNSTSLLMQHHIPLHPTTWNVLHQFTWPYMAQPGSYRVPIGSQGLSHHWSWGFGAFPPPMVVGLCQWPMEMCFTELADTGFLPVNGLWSKPQLFQSSSNWRDEVHACGFLQMCWCAPEPKVLADSVAGLEPGGPGVAGASQL